MAEQVAMRAASEPAPRRSSAIGATWSRISHEGWALADPRRVRRAPDGGGVVGRRRRTEHHAGGDDDRDVDGAPMSAEAFIEQVAVDLGATRWPIEPAR